MQIYLIFIFILGLCVGSFLNVLICRLPKEEKITGRSYCPHCKKTIAWYDLIPVFSFIWLRGECRYCKKNISFQYPLVEITTGVLFLLIFNFSAYGGPVEGWQILTLAYQLFAACCLLMIFVIDLKHYIIPDEIVYPAIAVALIFNSQFLFFNEFSIFKFSILSAIGAALFFFLIVLISKGKAMGLGDVKLGGFLGLFLGWPNILIALFLSFLLGAIIGLGLVIFKKKNLKSMIPFGPFLVVGTFITMFFGQNIIGWYLNFII